MKVILNNHRDLFLIPSECCIGRITAIPNLNIVIFSENLNKFLTVANLFLYSSVAGLLELGIDLLYMSEKSIETLLYTIHRGLLLTLATLSANVFIYAKCKLAYGGR